MQIGQYQIEEEKELFPMHPNPRMSIQHGGSHSAGHLELPEVDVSEMGDVDEFDERFFDCNSGVIKAQKHF
jgi:hypothetical protein